MDNDYLIATQKQFETRVSCTEGKKTKSADEPETNEGLGDKVYEEEHDQRDKDNPVSRQASITLLSKHLL